MKFMVYIIWTMAAGVFLKFGLDRAFDIEASLTAVISLILFVQIAIVYPLLMAIGFAEARIRENR
jgi:hypothetical protein